MTLRKSLEARIRPGHPWVFRDALADPPRLADGTPVLVRARDRRPLAVGFWDATSPIAVRLLTTRARERPLPGLVAERLDAALARPAGPAGPGPHQRLPLGARRGRPAARACTSICMATWPRSASTAPGARAFYRELPDLLAAAARPLRLRAVIDRETPAAAVRAPAGRRCPTWRCGRTACSFGVDLQHGQKGGLFLDQRENRAEVGRRSAGKIGAEPVRLHRRVLGVRRRRRCPSHRHRRSRPTGDRGGPRELPAQPAVGSNAAGFHAERRVRVPDRRRETGATAGTSSSPTRPASPRGPAPCPPRARPTGACISWRRRSPRPGGLFCPASCSSHFPRAEFLASVEDGLCAPPAAASQLESSARRRLRSPGRALVPRGRLPEVRHLPACESTA